MGGINFNPSSIALDQPRTLANGDVGFFTGEDNSDLTARVIQWMNTDYTIAVADGAYTPDPQGTFNPWDVEVQITGTNGN